MTRDGTSPVNRRPMMSYYKRSLRDLGQEALDALSPLSNVYFILFYTVTDRVTVKYFPPGNKCDISTNDFISRFFFVLRFKARWRNGTVKLLN